MRNLLLASVALATAGGIGPARAQAPAPPVGAPTQGQVAYPLVNPTAYVNSNNNYQATMLKGSLANPMPGTIVVHINGRVVVQFMGLWSSADQRFATDPAAGSLGATLGNNGTGVVKLQPQNLSSYARLYFGADGMATNGLRYGAAIEVRQNFTGQISNNGSSGASGYSSLNTLYVRRAFTYVAGENWGILRAGQADGIIGIFDNNVTTFQFLPTSNLNGGDLQNWPQNVVPPFWFASQGGNEYGNTKLVYLSPQFAGFDFGIQYAPNTSNGFGMTGSNNALNASITGAGTGTGLGCTVANSGCPSLSSGPGSLDGSRILNQTAVGVRYQGTLGDVGVLAYVAYEFSGHANYTGAAASTPAGASALGISALPGSKYTGQYDGLSFGNAGLAVTYGGVTVGGNIIGGRVNGTLALAPKGGVGTLAYLLGAKYVIGPWTVGVAGEIGWYQGSAQMSGLSQRRGRGIDVGTSYSVAPGYQVFAEYIWNDIQQGGVDLNSGSTGSAVNNNIKGQGFLIGNVVNF